MSPSKAGRYVQINSAVDLTPLILSLSKDERCLEMSDRPGARRLAAVGVQRDDPITWRKEWPDVTGELGDRVPTRIEAQ